MGRPRKRRPGRPRSVNVSITDSSGLFDDSSSSDLKHSRKRKHKYLPKHINLNAESVVRLTRSSLRSSSGPPSGDAQSNDAEVSHHTISPSMREGSAIIQHSPVIDRLNESGPSMSVQHKLPESPIGQTMRKRRQASSRLVHFNGDSNGSVGMNGDDFLAHQSLDRLTPQGEQSDGHSRGTDSPGSNVARRLRPRPPEAMVRYSLSRAYRHSPEFTPREHKRRRRTKRALKARFMRRPSRTRHTVTLHSRLRNVESTADEGGGSGEERNLDEDCADGEEHATSDTRRYPVRNRRHTDVYQVEYAQNNHGPTRNWLAGTGYENGRRRRRHRSNHHHGLQHCGSSTSSSMDSSSDSSAPGSPTFRHRLHTSWHREPAAPNDASIGPDKDETRFARRCTKSIMHARSELMPINMKRNDLTIKSALNDRLLSGTSLADIEPMALDESVGFDQIGGHESHILALKESIILPLMYPEIFSQFGIDPPRGVLFSGPPGTGKTLLARALANECTRMTNSKSGDPVHRRPIAFFMRKGADCLSKWVGESERQLRLLFDQAYRMRPSIIFFDEIDGLAPVRSSRQDQIHSSIVSTLLSLMDGLDQRAEVVIIGATNRPDSIDPALRRPGRFDREFTFGLPCESVRQRILEVHTSKWDPKPCPELLQQLAHATNNFSGADLKALVTEACLCCLRRQYPQVYQSRVKLALERKYLVVNRSDWIRALQLVRPSNDRSDWDISTAGALSPSACALASTKRVMLSPPLVPLLSATVNRIVELFRVAFCPTDHVGTPTIVSPLKSNYPSSTSILLSSPKLLLTGDLPDHVVSAVWHRLEFVQVYTLNLTNLVAFPSSTGMCPEAALAQILSAVKRSILSPIQNVDLTNDTKATRGVVLFIPHVDTLLHRLPYPTAVYLVDRLQSLVHDLAAETVHCPLPLMNSAVGFSDLSQAVSQSSRRLLLVATMRNRNPVQPPLLKGLLSADIGSNPTQRIPDLRSSRGHGTPTHGASNRRSNENWSPVRQLNPNSSPQHGEKLCNGIVRSRHTSTGSGRHSISSNTPVRSIAGEQVAFQNGVLPDGNILVCSSGQICPCEQDDCLSDAVSSSDSSLSSGLSVSACRPPCPITSGAQTTITRNPQSVQRTTAKSGRSTRLLGRLFSRSSTVQLHVNPPSKADRAAYFTPVLLHWAQNIGVLDPNTHSRNQTVDDNRPPSPIPLPESPDTSASAGQRSKLTREELLQLERQEAQLFRRLRQVLRRVVAHLARHRRFAVFARPVQVDEAPDYYEVIKHPMDLGTIRDRIDADRYKNVDDFMKDIELIYYNALEYNPANVPRSRDIRSRASEFWDEACLRLEEELDPPDLNERCKEAVEAQAARASLAICNRGTRTQVTETNGDRQAEPRGADSSRSIGSEYENAKVSELQVKLHPMPLGGRYSRRLHGEPPILENVDVHVLEQISGRRSTSLSHSLTALDSSPLRAKLDLDQVAVDSDHSIADEQMSSATPPVNATIQTTELCSPLRSEAKVSSPTIGTTSLPSPIHPPTCSPTLESTCQPRSPDPTDVTVDSNKLSAFHEAVVNGTAGWSVNQLIRLYAEFCSVLSTSQTKQVQLFTNLERVFKTHVKQNVAVELHV